MVALRGRPGGAITSASLLRIANRLRKSKREQKEKEVLRKKERVGARSNFPVGQILWVVRQSESQTRSFTCSTWLSQDSQCEKDAEPEKQRGNKKDAATYMRKISSLTTQNSRRNHLATFAPPIREDSNSRTPHRQLVVLTVAGWR